MGIKVLAGDWEPGTVCLFEASFFGKPDRIRMARVFGPEYPADQVVSIEIITEQNSTSILKKAGWGIVGGMVLGPVGLLAGVLGGGNRHEKVVSIEFTDGKRALLQCDTKSYGQIMRLTYRKRSEPTRSDSSHALPVDFRKNTVFAPEERRDSGPTKEVPDLMKGVSISFGKDAGR